MKPLITEQLPGSSACRHDWQKISEDRTSMTLVCRNSGCNATKKVPKPTQTESVGQKPVLLG